MMGRGGFGFSVRLSGIGGSSDVASADWSTVGKACCPSVLGSVSGAGATGGAGRLMIGRGLGGLAGGAAFGSVPSVFPSGVSSGCSNPVACATDGNSAPDASDSDAFAGDMCAATPGIATSLSTGFPSSGFSSEVVGLDSTAGRLMTGRGLGGFGMSSETG